MPAPRLIQNDILNVGLNSKDLELLKEWGNYFSKKGDTIREGNREFQLREITTSQIRKFFGEIKRIQADFQNLKDDIILLDPKIAYAVGRARKDGNRTKLEDFYRQLSPLLLNINKDEKKFKNFVNLVEAIVAYHKASGGL